jgi:hypothetical protein
MTYIFDPFLLNDKESDIVFEEKFNPQQGHSVYKIAKFIASSIYFTKSKKFQLCHFQFHELTKAQVKVLVPIDIIRFLSDEFIYSFEAQERYGHLYTIDGRIKFKVAANITENYDWCEAPAKLKYLDSLR